MAAETSTYVVIALALLNAGLVLWVLVTVRAKTAGAADNSLVLARFDGMDRNAEALRRELNQLAQSLLAEIAKGARDGLAAAFDKVQEGSRAQSEELARIQDAITQFGGNVNTSLNSLRQEVSARLAESETRAADGRASNEKTLSEQREAITAQLNQSAGEIATRLNNELGR